MEVSINGLKNCPYNVGSENYLILIDITWFFTSLFFYLNVPPPQSSITYLHIFIRLFNSFNLLCLLCVAWNKRRRLTHAMALLISILSINLYNQFLFVTGARSCYQNMKNHKVLFTYALSICMICDFEIRTT